MIYSVLDPGWDWPNPVLTWRKELWFWFQRDKILENSMMHLRGLSFQKIRFTIQDLMFSIRSGSNKNTLIRPYRSETLFFEIPAFPSLSQFPNSLLPHDKWIECPLLYITCIVLASPKIAPVCSKTRIVS